MFKQSCFQIKRLRNTCCSINNTSSRRSIFSFLKPTNDKPKRREFKTEIIKPEYALTESTPPGASAVPLKQKQSIDIESMTKICQLTRRALNELCELVENEKASTTGDLDDYLYQFCLENNAYPSPYQYHGFPATICTSINDVAAHGIPKNSEKLNKGDVVNIDVSLYKYGHHGDTSKTIIVGGEKYSNDEKKQLLNVSLQALNVGINCVKPGVPWIRIAKEIDRFMKDYPQLTVTSNMVGHGIGREFHCDPIILHTMKDHEYVSEKQSKTMQEGDVFTIEPIVCVGNGDLEVHADDGWTASTVDGGLSAMFEHTVLVTRDGARVLTSDE